MRKKNKISCKSQNVINFDKKAQISEKNDGLMYIVNYYYNFFANEIHLKLSFFKAFIAVSDCYVHRSPHRGALVTVNWAAAVGVCKNCSESPHGKDSREVDTVKSCQHCVLDICELGKHSWFVQSQCVYVSVCSMILIIIIIIKKWDGVSFAGPWQDKGRIKHPWAGDKRSCGTGGTGTVPVFNLLLVDTGSSAGLQW